MGMNDLVTALKRIGNGLCIQKVCDSITLDWKESDHPRGQPDNAGQFVKKGSGAASNHSGGEGQCSSGGGEGKGGESSSKSQGRSHGKITPEEDAAYMSVADRIAKAHKSGAVPDAKDVEEAMKMVRMAASRAMPDTKVVDEDGLPLVVYHGSEDFDPINGSDHVFDNTKYDGSRQIGAEKGYFFTSDYTVASRFGKKGNNRYVPNWKQLLEGTIFHNEKEYEEFREKLFKTNTPQTDKKFFDMRDDYFDIEYKIRKEKERVDKSNLPIVTAVFLRMRKANEVNGEMIGTGLERSWFLDSSSRIGDGAIIFNADTGEGISDEYVVFNSNQIKSADPVTYDDAGNVIPLSRRFDTGNDIRGAVK